MTRSHALFTLPACGLTVVLACTSAPDGGMGSGGSTGSGSASSSGGTSPTSGGGPGSGGAASGGTSSGGTSSGGTSTGGSNSSGGLGGETASGGAEASGGSSGVGGTGGTPSEVYVPCDADLGSENNPACNENEICASSLCAEICPTVFEEALVYECPQPTTGEAQGRCQYVLGRCYLLCETQGGPSYTCPDGMVCNLGACAWPE